MADIERDLNGIESAAVLLMSVGEEHAARVLKHMGANEVQRIGAVMSSLADISQRQSGKVLQQLFHHVQGQTALGIGSDEYVRNVLHQTLGPEKAKRAIPQVLEGRSREGLEALKWLDAEAIGEVIRTEHPQVVAVVLSQLEPEKAAGVVALIPESERIDILLRVARIDRLQATALQELNHVLEHRFSSAGGARLRGIGGSKTIADILNFVDSVDEEAITNGITAANAELAQEIRDLMFVFDDLMDVDDRGMQKLLREVSSDSLVVALKGADDSIKDKIFKNMSERAADMLKDDLETKGPVKLSEVEAAQREILSVAQKLAETGDLILGGRGSDEYV